MKFKTTEIKTVVIQTVEIDIKGTSVSIQLKRTSDNPNTNVVADEETVFEALVSKTACIKMYTAEGLMLDLYTEQPGHSGSLFRYTSIPIHSNQYSVVKGLFGSDTSVENYNDRKRILKFLCDNVI